MPKASEASEANQISTEQAAKLIMVSSVWLSKLSQQGYVTKVGRDRWNLVNVVQGYIKWLKDEGRRSSKSAAASRVQDLKAEALELQMAERRRELIPVDDADAVFAFIAATVRDEISGLPGRVTRDRDLRADLEREVHGSLDRLSRRFEKAGRALVEGGELFEAG